jgi:ABC-type multidrug transport system ATPase subunit
MSSVLSFVEVGWTPPGRELPVFSGLALELLPGELAVLTSGLGGGKSSALRLAVGLESPTTGSVLVCGRPPSPSRQRVGYVAGEGALLANLSLYDNLVLPLRWLRDPPAAEIERRAREALALFGIDSLPAVAPAYAPTNLRRLVALARAMILGPSLLVLDDPTDDFDSDSAEEVWNHLADIASAQGLAILAAATNPPRLPSARIVALSGASLPTTRRFSSAQRRTAVVPAIRPSGPITAIAPKAVHPDILARRHQP